MTFVLKVCGGTWENASRDKRELATYQELGMRVAVLAKGNNHDYGRIDEVDGFKVYRMTSKPLGPRVPSAINRIAALFCWARYIKKLKPDIISGHDLLPGLTIAWLSNLFNPSKAILIYDSHEFEIGRNARRNVLGKIIIKCWEGFLIRRCAFSIMVNQSIADEVQKIHKLSTSPIVVRSIPEYWSIDWSICHNKRQEMLNSFRNKEDIRSLLMFHGNLGRGNGIELLISLLQRRKDVGLVLLGNRTDMIFYDELTRLAAQYAVEDRFLYLPAVDISELWKYVGAVDVEMMMIEPIVRSHYYVLPNKMFEAIQSETPIIASNLPEMKKIIEQYNIGLTCDAGDLEETINCVNRLLDDKDFYCECKENLVKAKSELCWENEKEIIVNAIRITCEKDG